jgi:hypothetical protein
MPILVRVPYLAGRYSFQEGCFRSTLKLGTIARSNGLRGDTLGLGKFYGSFSA